MPEYLLRERSDMSSRSDQEALHQKFFPVLLCSTRLAQSTSQHFFVLRSLCKVPSSTTLYYKACKKYVPVPLCTTKLAPKIVPSTTLYYKACTKHVWVLLCSTKLAKGLPSTTLYHKACTGYFPAQSTSQHFFVLRSLCKVPSSTTLYYKACTKHVPVPLCTTKLAQKVLPSTTLYYTKFLHRETFWHILTTEIAAPYPDPGAKGKKLIVKHFRKGCFQGKSPAPKWRENADKSLSQPWWSHSNTIYNAQLQKTKVLRMQPRNQATLTQPHRTNKVPFIAGCSHFKQKNTRFRAPAFSPSHYNAFCSIAWQTCMYLRIWQHKMTTIMQPFKCDLQPQIQETQRTTHAWATLNNQICRTPRENRFDDETIAAATAAHTRYLSVPPAATAHWKTHGFVLWLPPQDNPNATFMQPLQCLLQHRESRGKPACIYAYDNTRWQQSCSHSNAICNHRFKKRKELRTHEQHWTTTRCRTPRENRFDDETIAAATAAHTQGTSQCCVQPLNTEKHKVWCSGFLHNTSPMQHSCSHYNAFCSIAWQTCMYLRIWQHKMTTIMQPFKCDLQPQIQETQRTTHAWATLNNQICRTPRENRFDNETIAAATAAHTRYLSVLPAATSRAPASSPTQAPCNILAAIQCLLQHRVANLHVSTHMATPGDNNHAAVPRRSATMWCKVECKLPPHPSWMYCYVM